MKSSHAEALERLYAAAIADDRSVLDPILGSNGREDANAADEVCTGFAGTIRFLRFVGGRFVPRITLERVSERGSTIEVQGHLRMSAVDRSLEIEFPFFHRHVL